MSQRQRVTEDFVRREWARLDNWSRLHQGRPFPEVVGYEMIEEELDKLCKGETWNTFLSKILPADLPMAKRVLKEIVEERTSAPKKKVKGSSRPSRANGRVQPSIEYKKPSSDLPKL